LKSPDSEKFLKINESNFAFICFHFFAFTCREFARQLHSFRASGWFPLWPDGRRVFEQTGRRAVNSPPEPILPTSGDRTRRSSASWAADEPLPNSKAPAPRWREAQAGAGA
jgi:hypothetical protein